MKKTFLFMALMLLVGAQTAAVAQELTVSDFQNSGCVGSTRASDNKEAIVLTKEGTTLKVQLFNIVADCDAYNFSASASSGTNNGVYLVSINVRYTSGDADCICPYNLSFTLHGLETNSFFLSCLWYQGMVDLTDGEPLVWGDTSGIVMKEASIDGLNYTMEDITLTARLKSGSYRQMVGDLNIPSEVSYEGKKYTVMYIGEYALAFCSELTSVTIPRSVVHIDHAAFFECSGLTDVYCYADNVPTTEYSAFLNASLATATLHVPAGSIDKYKTTSPWSGFGSIVALPTPKILPFVQDGKVWSYYVTNFNHEWEETYSLEGDTTISSRKCVKLYYNQNLYQGAMFEEGGKVYIITPGSTTPALMYDFSSEPGTIINVGPFELRIKEKKLVKYHGEYLKVIYYSLHDPRVDEDFEGQWVDGIGLTVGSLTNLIDGYSPGLTGGERYLKTCSINGEVVYERQDFYTSAQIVNENEVNYATDQMATIVLPTVPDASKGKYYRLDRCEDGQIIFEQELQPQAHIPYIIVPSEDFSIDTSTLDLAGLSNDTVSIEGISFIGSYVGETLNEPEGFYIDIIDTTPDCGFSTTEETGKEAYIGALRAYLQVSWDEPYNHGGSKVPGEKMGIVLRDYGTGISSLTPDPIPGREDEMFNSQRSMFNDIIYDLSGRKINSSFFTLHSSLKKGIYIKDGKKMIK